MSTSRRTTYWGFFSEEYNVTNVDTDKIPLSDVWNALRESRTYFNQMDLRMSRELSQKLKNKGFEFGGSEEKPTSTASSLMTSPSRRLQLPRTKTRTSRRQVVGVVEGAVVGVGVGIA